VLANKGAGAREIISRLRLAYEALPKWLQRGVKEWNKGSIELENGCKVVSGTTTSSSLRGVSCSYLYIDEAAFIRGYEEFFTSVYPTISSGKQTKLLITSTPNGLNHFHETWTGAEQGLNGYANVRVTWDMVPGRDEAWKEQTLKKITPFRNYYDLSFNDSGTLVIEKQGTNRRETTLITKEGLHDYYELLDECINNKIVPPKSDNIIYNGETVPYNKCDYCWCKDICKGSTSYDGFINQAKELSC
jgi:hypothetical protein